MWRPHMYETRASQERLAASNEAKIGNVQVLPTIRELSHWNDLYETLREISFVGQRSGEGLHVFGQR